MILQLMFMQSELLDLVVKIIAKGTRHSLSSLKAPGVALHVVGEVNITGISGDGSGKAVCIKSDRTLGTCSDAVGGSGTCTCG